MTLPFATCHRLTQDAYIRAVKRFSLFFQQSPDKRTFEHVREYQLHLASAASALQAINQAMCAHRFFYKTTLGKKEVAEHYSVGAPV